MHSPGWVRPGVRAAAAVAVLAALVSCGHTWSPATSSSSRGLPYRNQDDATYSWVSVNELNGVAAVSAHSVWAVGSAATGKTLIEHWDGRAWQQVPSASPRGAQESLLNSVAATGSSTAWAVGYYNTGKATRTLIERWNGRGWVQVPSPSPGGTDARLNGVAAAGNSSAWAVGYYFGPPLRPLIERWDGRAWKVVTSPNPGDRIGGTLTAVTTTGGSAAWAAGSMGTRTVDQPLIERWDGRAWKQVASPRPAGSHGSTLTGIAASSPANAWAVGYYWTEPRTEPAVRTLIERWNGRAWTQEPSPNPGGPGVHSPDQSLLQGVGAVPSSQAWAAGFYSSGDPRGKILIERRAGGTWSQMPAGP